MTTRPPASPAVPEVLLDPTRNRGVAFTHAERAALGLRGGSPRAYSLSISK
jgi:malate dehydrogenase (oxaloacetate-decarboxylating)